VRLNSEGISQHIDLEEKIYKPNTQ